MNSHLSDYPLTNTSIQIGNRQIQLTIVDEPDRFLDKLSREDSEGRLFLPYWTYLWESAIGLAIHISELGELTGQFILEIGCGYGLAGTVASQADAIVVFTDFEYDALQFAWHNTKHNGVRNPVLVQMDWNTTCFKCKFDLIIASDVIYEEQNWVPILELLQSLLAPEGIALFSEPNRKNADGFFNFIRDNGFTFKKSNCSIPSEHRTIQINIYTIKRI